MDFQNGTAQATHVLENLSVSPAWTGLAEPGQARGEDIFLVALLCPLTLACIGGNGLVLTAILSYESLRVPQNYFIFSLALSDLLNGFVFPVYVTSHTQFFGIKEHLGIWEVCDSILVALVAVQMASSYNLVTITGGRYLAVKYPLRHRKVLNRKRALIIVLLVWAISTVISVCIYARLSFDSYTGECRYELFLTVRHISAFLVFTVLIPLMVMACFYVLIQFEFRKNMKIFETGQLAINGSLKSRHIHHEHRLIKMATILLSYFSISWMPFVICTYIAISCDCSINPYFRAGFRLLYFSNSAINVLVYAGRHPDFRRAFRRMVLRLNGLRCEHEEAAPSCSLTVSHPPTAC